MNDKPIKIKLSMEDDRGGTVSVWYRGDNFEKVEQLGNPNHEGYIVFNEAHKRITSGKLSSALNSDGLKEILEKFRPEEIEEVIFVRTLKLQGHTLDEILGRYASKYDKPFSLKKLRTWLDKLELVNHRS